MKIITLVVLVAGLLVVSLAAQGNSDMIPLHTDYGDGHCNLRHGSSIVYVGYTFHLATGKVVASSWDRRKLAPGQKATKSHDYDVITVKIRQRTPYNTYVTVASKSCWGGH